ncbi:MAG: formate/nitrite transporter family protein [Acetobacteraceae bacterium]
MPDGPITPNPVDAYAPAQVAHLVEAVGVRKANLPLLPSMMLSLLAGAFISFGACFYMIAMTDSGLGWGPTRLLGGLVFSTGLILVIVGGAELFTGNSLIVMAWAQRRIGSVALLRNWTVVLIGNLIGAVATAIVVAWSGAFSPQALAATAIRIAEAKVTIGFTEAFLRGVLCNVLVCLAVWLSFSARTVADKVLAIPLPIAAFVALGFEHSIANMFFLPLGWLVGSAKLGLMPVLHNLVPVTLGNIVGGGALVAGVYWAIYLRPEAPATASAPTQAPARSTLRAAE